MRAALDELVGLPWQELGSNLFDRRARDLETQRSVQVVEAVSVDAGGGFTLEVSGGWRIVVAPASSSVGEFWRYFHAGDEHHFVVFPGDGDAPTQA